MNEQTIWMALGYSSVELPHLEETLMDLARDPDFARVFAAATLAVHANLEAETED